MTPDDELRHPDVAVESWWWWAADASGDAALFVGFELRGSSFDYVAGLARRGHDYLYVEELDGAGLRAGLEIKPPEMWADHVCDVPWQQWSVGNEAFGVELDDPDDVWRGARGALAPVAFDIEWYADAGPEPLVLLPGSTGYRQRGQVDAHVELREGVLALAGPSDRLHVWGAPYRPLAGDTLSRAGALRLPYRDRVGTRVDQALTVAGWERVTVLG